MSVRSRIIDFLWLAVGMLVGFILAVATGVVSMPKAHANENGATNVPPCAAPKAIAHRGGSEHYTENSLSAYVDSAKYGILQWETDVQFDRNGVPFLMHDATLDRTSNGTGPATAINVLTTTVRLNDGQRIPTLDQFLASARSHGAYAMIEPKNVPTAAQANTFVGLLAKHEMRPHVLVDSFYPANLAPIRKLDPTLGFALVAGSGTQSVATVKAVGVDFFKDYRYLTLAQLQAYNTGGVTVYAWTLDTPAQWAPVRAWPLEGVVTNRPIAYNAWRANVCYGAF